MRAVERGCRRTGIVVPTGSMESGEHLGGGQDSVCLMHYRVNGLDSGNPDEIAFVGMAGPQSCQLCLEPTAGRQDFGRQCPLLRQHCLDPGDPLVIVVGPPTSN